jgi:transcriptional regulator with XRE-family HTH domain
MGGDVRGQSGGGLGRGRPPRRLDPDGSATARLGAEIRRLREARRLTIAALASLVGYSPSFISDVENGNKTRSRQFVEACERVFDTDGSLLTLFEEAIQEETARRHAKLALSRQAGGLEGTPLRPSVPVQLARPDASEHPLVPGSFREEAATNRRDALRVGAKVAGIAAGARMLEGIGSLPFVISKALHSSTISNGLLQRYEREAEQYVLEYQQTGPDPLLVDVHDRLVEMQPWVKSRQSTAQQRRLSRVVAQLASLMGIFMFDAERYKLAHRWFDTALDAAGEAEDDTLSAWVLIGKSFVPIYSGDAQGALRLIRRGQSFTGSSASVARAMLAGLEARVQATMGNLAESRAALKEAEVVLDAAPKGELAVFSFTEAQLAFYAGTAFVRLRQPDVAQDYAHQALALYGSTPHYMDPALVRLDMARSYLQQGEIEQACNLGSQVLAGTPGKRPGPIDRRARELGRELKPYADSPVARDFSDRLRTA